MRGGVDSSLRLKKTGEGSAIQVEVARGVRVDEMKAGCLDLLHA